MTKSELIAKLTNQNTSLSAQDIENVVNTILEEITTTLVEGNRVELRGFGAFSVRERAARQARNPRTGEKVSVGAKRVPFFKMGKELKERINN
jgi:integration host factor subunit beta